VKKYLDDSGLKTLVNNITSYISTEVVSITEEEIDEAIENSLYVETSSTSALTAETVEDLVSYYKACTATFTLPITKTSTLKVVSADGKINLTVDCSSLEWSLVSSANSYDMSGRSYATYATPLDDSWLPISTNTRRGFTLHVGATFKAPDNDGNPNSYDLYGNNCIMVTIGVESEDDSDESSTTAANEILAKYPVTITLSNALNS
jgi:hypothetical protein